jgi:hypothetical protein
MTKDKLIKDAGDRAVEAIPDAKPDAKQTVRTKAEAVKAGKVAAREMLLKATRKVRLTRDCPTSKGRLSHGMTPRLPHREADALVKARAAEELDG